MKGFEGKVAAVTGAASGIGRALAMALSEGRCDLALSDVDEVGLAKTAADAVRSGVRVTTAVVDVADRAAVEAWAEGVVADHGRVNLLFNNAGVAMGSTLEDEDYPESLHWLMGINFWGVVHGSHAFLPHLSASGDGHLVNVSSLFGIVGIPTQSAYCASKFAVRGFTEAVRQDCALLGLPVTVSCVHPGGIKTSIARRARMSSGLVSRLFDDADQGREVFDRAFITSPEKAAAIILAGVRRRRARILVGRDAVFFDFVARMLPVGHRHFVRRLVGMAIEKRRRGRAGRAEAA
jgi:NAD(P)-dependent dehydrogenase (short-subunit alcohol dehydrogenase family)